jgi:hypothetical protein
MFISETAIFGIIGITKLSIAPDVAEANHICLAQRTITGV